MTIVEFITELLCRIDDAMKAEPRHSQASLSPSEWVPLGLLPALKGGGTRPCYRWRHTHQRALVPTLPERTRLFRRLQTQQDGTDRFLASPTLLGVSDTYGRELIHPVREGRGSGQIGQKGTSNSRWIGGGTLCLVLNRLGLVVAGDCDTANVHDATFHPLIERCQEQMVVRGATGCHRAEAAPPHRKRCRRRAWHERMWVETVLSLLTVGCHIQKMRHRVWRYFTCRLAYLMAACNLLVQWHGLKPEAQGVVRLSIAQFAL